MNKIIAGLAALLAAALTLGLAGPASADLYGLDDPDDNGHGSDLRAVSLWNARHKVVVKTLHTNLRRDWSTGSSELVYVDTDRGDRGPEFVFSAGLYEGAEYGLFHTEGFGHKRWGKQVRGWFELDIDYRKDIATMRMSRKALGHPGKVRVAVKSAGYRTDGTTVTDWLGDPRSFTPWIARG